MAELEATIAWLQAGGLSALSLGSLISQTTVASCNKCRSPNPNMTLLGDLFV